MSLQPQAVYLVPEATARVARAAFPKGNPYLRMHDELGRLYADADFAALFPTRGQPALAPAQLALVTLMQFAENLSDRQAAEAVRARIDWKYALCLELDDPGFDYSVLSEFRARLLAHEQEGLLFDLLLARCREAGLVRARGRQRTDSTQVLAAIRDLNRLELVGETLRHALHALAAAVPDWLRQHCPAAWAERYGQQLSEYRLPQEPAARRALAVQIGADGRRLLEAVRAPSAPAWLREIPAVETLRQVWVQHYHAPDDDGTPGWRAEGELPPCARRITSPHDPEARFATKRETSWTGYKVHLTEACEPDAPLLITQVQTTAATAADSDALAPIHRSLAEAQLLPGEHLVDAGYLDADNLVASRQDHGVALVGPPLGDTHWQARTAGAFDVDCFAIDWEARRATCPQGHASGKWSETTDPLGNTVITTHFPPAACRACPCRAQCTRSAQGPRRLTLRPPAQHLALRAARARRDTPSFAAQYAPRAGVEGTISQGVNTFALREARYLGFAKTKLQHLLTGAAMNVARLAAWFAERPRAATRPSRLAFLAT
jgi:transposase